MTPPTAKPRTLSTADERRTAVLEAGMTVMAERGFVGTPTTEVAKAAGISQAYLFRLYPTKSELAVAVIRAMNDRIYATFANAAAQAKAAGDEDVIHAMGESYSELIQDRSLVLLQLHGHAASPGDPAIRDAMRDGFRSLYGLIKAETGAEDEEISSFFATGMLINVLAAMSAYELDEPWAQHLCLLPTLDDPDVTA